MQIQKPASLWSTSTQSRVPKYMDNFLFNFVQSGVRSSTQSLLHSLFKKGNEQQRRTLLTELATRIKDMNCVGRASEQIIGLLKNIIAEKCQVTKKQQIILLELISELTKTCLSKLIEHPNFQFYKFCEDMVDNGKGFKPHLFELNGCVKCYGDIENNITPNQRRLEEITEENRVSGNRMVFRLKMTYEIRDFTVKLTHKASTRPPTLIIWYWDVNTKTLVRQGPYNSQPMNLTTNQIQLEFENMKPSGGRCLLCNNKIDEQNIFCGNCKKGLEIDLKYKMLGGDSEKIMKELGQNYKTLMVIRKKADALYKSVTNHTTIKNIMMVDVNELERIYSQIMLNLSLLEPAQAKTISAEYTIYESKWLCFSCNYIQTDNLLGLFNIPSLSLIYKLNPKFISQQLGFLTNLYLNKTLPNCLQKKLIEALASICIVISGKQAPTVTNLMKITQANKSKEIDLLKAIILKSKDLVNPEDDPNAFNLQLLNTLYIESCQSKILTPFDKTELAAMFLIKKEDTDVLNEVDQKRTDRLKQIKKLTEEQVGPMLSVLNFDKQQYLKMEATSLLLVLMALLPVEMLPDSTIDIQDEAIIPFINCKLPEISHNLEIIRTPKPMVPLGAFGVLPTLGKFLVPSEGLKLVKEILKFKKLWNLNLYNTLKSCDQIMETLERDQQLKMCLEGLASMYEDYFLNKIHSILVPKRRQFIIRVDPPERQIKKNTQQLQYQIIKVRQLKTQDLPGYTMADVMNWITTQLTQPMPMDLIVEGHIINNVDVPIEMVYKKLVRPDDGSKPLNPGQHDTFRVIYRLRGFFGEPTEKDAGNLGDDQKDLCLSYAPILTQKISDLNLCGLDILFRLFKKFQKNKQNRSSKKALLQIMNMIFINEMVRDKAIQLNYTDMLIRTTLKFLSSKDDDSVQDSHSLLQTVSKLIDQANKTGTIGSVRKISADRKGSTDMEIQQEDKTMESASKNISLVLSRIADDEKSEKKNRHIIQLVKLLPFSSKDIMELSEKIFDFLNPFEAYQKSKKLDNIQAFLQALPEHFLTFKQLCYDRCLITVILQSVCQILPNQQSVNQKNISAHDKQLIINLNFLKSLVRGFQTAQKDLYDRKLIPILHKLSTLKVSHCKSNTVAEQIINDLATKSLVLPQAAEEARGFKQKHARESKLKSEQARQAHLEELRKKRANIAQKIAVDMSKLKKEYLTCVSCKAGYEERNILMGIYSFWTKQEINSLDSWWTECKRMSSITSLTTFTTIHYECHKQAQNYNSQERKTEWQGAQARNCDARCNNWIPVRGPSTPDDEFDKISRKYFEHNKGGNFWVIINDLKGLLIRLAYQEDLPKDSNGSILNNSKLIAVLVSFASSYMKRAGQQQKFIQQGMTTLEPKLPETSQQMHLYIVNSIFTLPYNKFQEWKANCLKKSLDFAVSGKHTHGKHAGGQDKFLAQKPLLIMLALVQFIFENIHAKIDHNMELLHAIESFVAQNLEAVLTQFEKIGDIYKELVKKASLEEYEPVLKVKL